MAGVALAATLVLAGCGNGAGVVQATPASALETPPAAVASVSPSIAPAETVGEQGSGYAAAWEAYGLVLKNEAEFFSTDHEKALYFEDFLVDQELYGTDFEATQFSVLDMDGDGQDEIVLKLSTSGGDGFYEILRYDNGTVYGYFMVFRGMSELKEDGTFSFSSGAADSGWGKLSFGPDGAVTEVLVNSQSKQDDTGLAVEYFKQGEQIEEAEFNALLEEQFKKQDVAWDAFSQENIGAALVPNA